MGIGRAMERLKNEIASNIESCSYEFPVIFRACDSFAIDYANKYWDPQVRKRFLDLLLSNPSRVSRDILTKFMRIMPHRYLWYCFKARSATGTASLFFGFLNFALYCCMGIDSATLTAGNPSESDYFRVLSMLSDVLGDVHAEIDQGVRNNLVGKSDAAEAESVAAEVAKLTLAESSEGQNDSAKQQSGKAKAILKGAIGFGTFIVLCSLGFPHQLGPVVAPMINTAAEKAF